MLKIHLNRLLAYSPITMDKKKCLSVALPITVIR